MAKRQTAQKTEGEKLDLLITLTQTLVAMEMVRGGLSQAQIGELLGIAAGSVNKLIKGYKPN